MANPQTELLLMIVNHITWRSESEQEHALDLLREVDSEDVPPPAGPMNAPASPPPSVDPGPVAEPVPNQEQTPPPTSPEVTGSPEESNAFSTKEPEHAAKKRGGART